MSRTRQAETRHIQDTLTIAGNGVIAFGLWTLLKTILFVTFVDGERLMQLLEIGEAPLAALYIGIGLVLAVDLGVRAFVGISARAEGHGKKKGVFYLIVAVLAALLNAISAFATLFSAPATTSYLDLAVSFIVELTSFVALAVVVYCSVRLRQMSATAS